MKNIVETTDPLELLNKNKKPSVVIDREYRIIATNQAYLDSYGGSASNVKGKHCYAVSHHYNRPCDQAGETCPLKNSLETGQPQRVLHLHHTPRGEEYVDVETMPIRNNAGEIIYFLESMSHSRIAQHQSDHGLIGKSPRFTQMLEMIERVAQKKTPVLLLGESGTGKELAAKAIHKASENSAGPFVAVECSGLTETLFESELYGHEKGAFTGAIHRKNGLVEAARGGTLFLDEIGDVPLSQQVKLLRLLETASFRRVGGIEPLKADFRLICATHRNLDAMIKEGTFRQDLYYRINTFPINLPPLRERQSDIELLCQTLIHRLDSHRNIQIHPAAMDCLKEYSYPGNVRELRNILERALIMADGDQIRKEHLPFDCAQLAAPLTSQGFNFPDEIIPLHLLEERYIRWIITRYSGDNRSLAGRLGISERTFYRKLELLK